jgi:hypothetical protein
MNYELGILIITIITLILVIILGFLALKVVLGYINLYYKNLLAVFRNNIEPKLVDFTPEVKTLVNLAIDIWKISKNIKKEDERLSHLVLRLNSHLSKFDISITDYTNQVINEDLNLDVLEIRNDPSLENNFVISTEIPSVFYKERLVEKAKVIINKK